MKKYRLNQLEINVTRRCNLYCNHCMCGDSQDVDISFEAIDRIFDSVKEIDTLIISGGEPLLNLPAVQYIVYEIIERNIAVSDLTIATNGTIQDEKVIKTVRLASQEMIMAYYRSNGHLISTSRMLDTSISPYVTFQISCDKWHDVPKAYETYCYYKEAFKKDLVTVQVNTGSNNTIKYKGRAETIPHQAENKIESSICRLRIESTRYGDKDYIFCPLSLTAKGNIVNRCSDVVRTYAEEDDPDNIIGNILNESMESMIDRWQQEHMMSCIEEQKLNDCKTAILNGSGTPEQEAYIETLDQVLDARKFYFDHLKEVRDMPFDVFRAFMKDDGTNHFNDLDPESYHKLNKLLSDMKYDDDKMSELNEIFRQYADGKITQDKLVQSIHLINEPKGVTAESIKDGFNKIGNWIFDFICYIGAKANPEMTPEIREYLNAWIEVVVQHLKLKWKN